MRMDQVVSQSTSTAAQVNGIDTALKEQRANVHDVAVQLDRMVGQTQHAANHADQLAQASTALNTIARTLQEEVAFFRTPQAENTATFF
jgi:methyl-accepting chemotaxis protein